MTPQTAAKVPQSATFSGSPPLGDLILSLLRENAGEEFNAKSIYRELRRKGVKCSYGGVRKALTRLVRRGLVARTKRGFYTVLMDAAKVPIC